MPRTLIWKIRLAFAAVVVIGLGGWVSYARELARRAAPERLASPRSSCASGVWGPIRCVALHMDPPANLIAPEACRTGRVTWSFPGSSREQVGDILMGAGVSPENRAELSAQLECGGTGCRVTPSVELIVGLDPQVRRGLYARLGEHAENVGPANPFSLSLGQAAAWRLDTDLEPRTLALFERLKYTNGSLVQFADLPTVCASTDDTEERVRLLRMLMREPSLLVSVRIDAADLESIEAYWGRGRRPEALRPLLTSLARTSEQWIDVSQLLPRFARTRLNRYPNPERPPRNCHWSSLNFFNREPDERFLSDEHVRRELAQAYVPVDGADVQLGDVVAFYSQKGELLHSASRITSDIVFTKNGMSVRAPWLLMRLSDVAAHYPKATVRYFRRVSLPS